MGDTKKMLQVRSARQVPVRVMLLDDEIYNDSVDKRAVGWVLFERVCEHLNLLEKDYFGLTYSDATGLKFWLNNDKKISKQMKGMNWDFRFEVKFYPPDPAMLAEDLTRYQVCLQIRRDMVNEKLPCSFVTYTLLGSYTAQSELGDFDTEEFGHGTSYLKDIKFAPHQDRELLQKIAELHRQHKGQTPEDAELHFLENAKKLAMYGVELHNARDAEGEKIKLGVCASGLIVYKDKVQMNRFVWPKVLKLSYRRKKFYIKIRPGEFEEFASLIGFRLESITLAKRLWKIAVEHHSFFRFREADTPKKVGLFPRFGSRFRYSGRTQFQSKQAVAEEDREAPQFDRVLSKRGTFSARTDMQRQRDEDRALRRDMREKERQRRRPEPPEPTNAPPLAPKPKPLPRGPPSVEDDLSEKGHVDSINDSFEDVPDRKSKIEKIHGVPTPLSAVLQKSLEHSDHEDAHHKEDSNSQGPPGYTTDDPERREVRSTSDIDNTNHSLYLFSYPSSVDSDLSETCGDYDASKPLSAHRCRTSSGSYMPRSLSRTDNLHSSVASIPQVFSGGQYEKIPGKERIYAEIDAIKKQTNSSKGVMINDNMSDANFQPKIYGRRSKHFVKNQKQAKVASKLPNSLLSLQNVAMANLLPNKDPTLKTLPLYAKINKGLNQPENVEFTKDRGTFPVKKQIASTEYQVENSNIRPETDNDLSKNKERIREELKMYILSPQATETNIEPIAECKQMVSNDGLILSGKDTGKYDMCLIETLGGKIEPLRMDSTDQIVEHNTDTTDIKEPEVKQVDLKIRAEGDSDVIVPFVAKSNDTVERHEKTNVMNIKHDKDTTAMLPLQGSSKVKHNSKQATRDWVNNIDTSFTVDYLDEAKSDIAVDNDMKHDNKLTLSQGEDNFVSYDIEHSENVTEPAASNAVVNDLAFLKSPAIVVSDCDKEQLSPYQLLFDSSDKIQLNANGQENDFDAQLERFSSLSSGSSDMNLYVNEQGKENKCNTEMERRLSTTSSMDKDLERFSTISSESSDLELKYCRQDDKDLSLEKFCTLSTDSSDGDFMDREEKYHGSHLTIPIKFQRKKQKRCHKETEINLEKSKTEPPDRSKSLKSGKNNKAQTCQLHGEKLKSSETEAKHEAAKCLTQVPIDEHEVDMNVKPTDEFGIAPSIVSIAEAESSMASNRTHSSKIIQSTKFSTADDSLVSSATIEKDKIFSSQPLKKSKSKDKLGISCIKPRTTSPFEMMEASEKDKNSQVEVAVRREKPPSVYKKVATQLSKPFVKKKSKGKLFKEGTDSEMKRPSTTSFTDMPVSMPISQTLKDVPTRNITENDTDICNLPRQRYNKPDWFKTYLLPDEHKLQDAEANEVEARGIKKDFDTAAGYLYKQPPIQVKEDKSVEKYNSDFLKDTNIYVSAHEKQFPKQNKHASDDQKVDQIKLGVVSRKKVSPGVIHMLNPCPSGWIQGGLEVNLKKDSSGIHEASNMNLTALKGDCSNMDLSEYKKEDAKLQVSALDFDLTKCSSEPVIDNDHENEGQNLCSKNCLKIVGDIHTGGSDTISESSESINHADAENQKEVLNSFSQCQTDPDTEKTVLSQEMVAPTGPVEDKLCQRKWSYKFAKHKHVDSGKNLQDTSNSVDEESKERHDHSVRIGLASVSALTNAYNEMETSKKAEHVPPVLFSSDLQKLKYSTYDTASTNIACDRVQADYAIDRVEKKITVDKIVISIRRANRTKIREANKDINDEERNKVVNKQETALKLSLPVTSSEEECCTQDPLDNGNIPFADDEFTDEASQNVQPKKDESEIHIGFPNIYGHKQANLCSVTPHDRIICECTFQQTYFAETDKKSESLTADSTLSAVAVRESFPNDFDKMPERMKATSKVTNALDPVCTDDAGNIILCECNFKPVRVTDLDGDSWYEEDEIHTVCNSADEKVPVIIEDVPFVPKKRILKSSLSAENIAKVGKKKGVRFHSNLPTWKKIGWKSESNLRRTSPVYIDKDDDTRKKKYIENFIMCMFEQEPRNLSLTEDEISLHEPSADPPAFADTDNEKGNIAGIGISQSALGIDTETQIAQESKDALRHIQCRTKTKSNIEDNETALPVKRTLEPLITDTLVFGNVLPDSHSKEEISESVLDDDNSDNGNNSPAYLKQPSVIARQVKPHSPKFFVPVAHCKQPISPSSEQKFAQVEKPGSGFTKAESLQTHHSYLQHDLNQTEMPLRVSQCSALDSCSTLACDVPACSETLQRNNDAYDLVSIEEDCSATQKYHIPHFKTNMPVHIADEDRERNDNELDFNRKYMRNQNTDNYADVSVIIPKTDSTSNSAVVPLTEDSVIISDTNSKAISKIEHSTMPLAQKHQSCEMEYQSVQDVNKVELEYKNEDQFKEDDNQFSTVVIQPEIPPQDSAIPIDQSYNPTKTTRYVLTLPDESDPESPKIKSVTYEYITEYRLNKVKVNYQHSKKVQTDIDGLG